jgi:cytochrome c biogenesis protein ResB
MVYQPETDTSTRRDGPRPATDREIHHDRVELETTETPVGREPADNRSLGDLLKELRDESSRLIRQEVELAKTEMHEKAMATVRDGRMIGVGSVLAHAGLIVLLIGLAAMATYALGFVMDTAIAMWVGPLIVGGLAVLIGYGTIKSASKHLKKQTAAPEKTSRSLQENKQWIDSKIKQST